MPSCRNSPKPLSSNAASCIENRRVQEHLPIERGRRRECRSASTLLGAASRSRVDVEVQAAHGTQNDAETEQNSRGTLRRACRTVSTSSVGPMSALNKRKSPHRSARSSSRSSSTGGRSARSTTRPKSIAREIVRPWSVGGGVAELEASKLHEVGTAGWVGEDDQVPSIREKFVSSVTHALMSPP